MKAVSPLVQEEAKRLGVEKTVAFILDFAEELLSRRHRAAMHAGGGDPPPLASYGGSRGLR